MEITGSRRLDIATTGGANTLGGRLSDELVAKYRAQWIQQGYDIPEWTGAPLPKVEVTQFKPQKSQSVIKYGVGSILKEWLGKWGINATEDCGCNAIAAEMDQKGPDWCLENIDDLSRRIAKKAKTYKWAFIFLPFKRLGATQLIKLAVQSYKTGNHTEPKFDDQETEVPFNAGDYRCAAMVYNRDGLPIPINSMYRGASAFLLCSGPSLGEIDPDVFQRAGVLSMAVNNVPSIVRPNMWVYVDSPSKWVEQAWLDPSIMKFVPIKHMNKPFKITTEKGNLVNSNKTIGELANVYGYHRNAEFHADRFLNESTFSWGCAAEVADDVGAVGIRSVMLVAVKMLYFLGVSTIYLVGCDWHMTEDKPYAFPQAKERDAVQRNNGLYRVIGARLRRLQPHLQRAGCQVYNTTPQSKLDVFPHIPLQQALKEATGHIKSTVITAGRY